MKPTLLSGLAALLLAGPLAAQDELNDANALIVTVPVSLSNLTRDTFGVSVSCYVEYSEGTALGEGTTYLLDTSREFSAWDALIFLDEEDPVTRSVTLEGFNDTVEVLVFSYDPEGMPIDACASGECELSVLAIPIGVTDRDAALTNLTKDCGPAPTGTASFCQLPGSESIGRVTFTRPGFGDGDN